MEAAATILCRPRSHSRLDGPELVLAKAAGTNPKNERGYAVPSAHTVDARQGLATSLSFNKPRALQDCCCWVLVAFTACSTLVDYNRVDILVRWYLDDYVSGRPARALINGWKCS